MFSFLKKLIPSALALSIVFGTVTVAEASEINTGIDTSSVSKGLLTVNAKETEDKLLVEKDGVRYTYDLQKSTNVSLQLGNGNYTLKTLAKVEGNKYKVVTSKTVDVTLASEQAPFLNSVQNVNWNEDMAAIKKAKELTKGLKTDAEKVNAIYNYITNKTDYDYKKAKTVAAGYVPDNTATFKDNKGICYDYASLFAAMLRSLKIPTKLVTGYSTFVSEYHAWNEVYLNGKWVVIDTTVDASLKNSKTKPTMIKKAKDYKVLKQY